MIGLNNRDLKHVFGGLNITGAVLNYLKGIFNIFFDFGTSLGSAIRRLSNKNLCKIR